MELKEIIIIPVYTLFILLAGFIGSELIYPKKSFKKYFLPGLILKILGSIVFGLIYQFYYKNGDTVHYFNQGKLISETLWKEPYLFWKVLTTQAGVVDLHTSMLINEMTFARHDPTYWVVKISAIVSIFSFNSYYGTALLFAAFAFSGMWALFRVFIKCFPSLEWQAALACLIIPSTIFWGSGILKDTITLGAMGWVVYGFYHLVIERKRMLFSFFLIYFGSILLLKIKFYIFASLIPAFLIWGIGHYSRNFLIQKPLKVFVWITTLCFLGLFSFYFRDSIANKAIAVSEIFMQKAIDFQLWHSHVGESGMTGGGSAYSLGEIDFTPMGIVAKIPASINVALFRPYPTEIHSPVVVPAAIESLIFLFLSLILFLGRGLKSMALMWRNPALQGFLIFTLLFAFMVGFSSLNFGALVRYKIPCLPFYTFLLLALFSLQKEKS